MILEGDASRVSDTALRRTAQVWLELDAEHGSPLTAFLRELACDVLAELDVRAAAFRELADRLSGGGDVGGLVESGTDPVAEAEAEFRRAVAEVEDLRGDELT